MRVPPLEFAVVELGVESDVFAGAFGDVQAEVGGVSGAGWDEVYVDDGASGPGVALVDGIAVAVDLERFVEVSARFDGTFALVFDFTAPEDGLAFFVGGLELEPDVEGVDGAAWKEVAYFAGADDDVDQNIIASTDGGVYATEWGGDGASFACRAMRS